MCAKASADFAAAVDLLAQTEPAAVPPVCAVFGDEPFLKRLVRQELKRRIAGGDAEFSVSEFNGPQAVLRDVLDELSTMSLFGDGARRVVVVDDADKFVTEYRPKLEDYVAKPSHAGVLILDVDTWPSNTKLYKAVAAAGLNIQCTSPTGAALVKWLVAWAKQHHRAKLSTDAAESLVDLVGAELGLLDQELGKLASAAGAEPISCELVDKFVGTWRSKTAWEMIDAVADGHGPAAMQQLDRLIAAGEHPIALLAQMSSTFRRFAAATRLLEDAERAKRPVQPRRILEQAGFKPFVMDKAERQWRQLGRKRSGRLYEMLLDADIALKGRSSAPARARLVLERFIAQLSTAGDPRKAATA